MELTVIEQDETQVREFLKTVAGKKVKLPVCGFFTHDS
jgi:hypothetical protein